jgi:hypothetical protein
MLRLRRDQGVCRDRVTLEISWLMTHSSCAADAQMPHSQSRQRASNAMALSFFFMRAE